MKATTIGILAYVFAALAGPASADDVSVTAAVSPSTVSVGEDLLLTIKVEGKFRNSTSPELPPLDAFYVYESGTSQSFSMVNGQTSASVTYSYTLTARKEGVYRIEPITYTVSDKRYAANSITVQVTPASQSVTPPSTNRRTGPKADEDDGKDQSIFIEATVDHDTVYVNQQVTWTLGYYTDGRVSLLRSPNYTPPDAEGFWVEDLPPQKQYFTSLHDRQYQVSEIKRGYFPTSPGVFIIGEARVDLVLDDFSAQRNRLDDFFRRGFSGFGRQHTLLSKTKKIVVLPLPLDGKPNDFSGIVARNLTVSMSADRQVVQVGEPVNVTVEVNGIGNMKTIAPPKLQELDRYKIYESGSSSDTFKRDYVVTGRRKYDFVIIPQKEGKWSIPPVEISYFDPGTRRYSRATTHPVPLDVQPGTQEDSRRVVYAGGGDDFEVISRDIRYIHPVPAAVAMKPRAIYESRVYQALHALPVLAVVLSLVVERRRRRLREDAGFARSSRAYREAIRKLADADRLFKRDDRAAAYGLVAGALLGYVADKENVPVAGLTSEDVAYRLAARGADEDAVARMRRLIATCDAARYAAGAVGAEQDQEARAQAAEIIRHIDKRYFS